MQFPPLDLFTFLILSLATFRISRLLTTDVILEDMRDRIWKKYSPLTKFGYLFTCMWCMSFWVALVIVICYTIIPTVAFLLALPFALSAVAGLVAHNLDK